MNDDDDSDKVGHDIDDDDHASAFRMHKAEPLRFVK